MSPQRHTYNHLRSWYNEVIKYTGEEIPMVLVANKIDMAYDIKVKEKSVDFHHDRPQMTVSLCFKQKNWYRLSGPANESLKPYDLLGPNSHQSPYPKPSS